MRKQDHYHGMDVLRCLAATLVLADHFGLYAWLYPSARAPLADLAFPALQPMTLVGSIGVEVFFLISGFVIAASALGKSARDFLRSRATRVLPALWICGLIALVARLTTGEPFSFLAASFARSAVLSPVGPYIDGVVWTLVVELAFYALIAVVLARGKFGSIATIARWLGSISAVFIVLMLVAQHYAADHAVAAHVDALMGRFPTKVLLLRHGVFFATGILLWSGFTYGFRRETLAWIAGLSLACTLEIGIDKEVWRSIAVSIAIWWAGFALLVGSVRWQAPIARVCSSRLGLLKDLGRLSYPLYLNHYTLGLVLVPALAATGLPRGAVFVVALTAIIVSSWLVMRYPERWLQRTLARVSIERTPEKPRPSRYFFTDDRIG